MGYTRQFAHSYTRNSLPDWKSHINLLLTEMIAAGWKYTGDTGQLDVDAVPSLPDNNTYAGYKILEIDDYLAATGKRIILKLEFGIGRESFASNYSVNGGLGIRLSIGTGTDGSGNLTGSIWNDATTVYPSSSTSIANINPPIAGDFNSYICSNVDRGFYGISYFNNGRSGPAGPSYSYGANASTFSIFVQRSLVDGIVTDDGFTVFTVSNLTTNWASSSNASRWPGVGNANPNRTRVIGFSYSGGTPINTTYPTSTPFRDTFPAIGNKVLVGPVHGLYPYPHIIPNLVTLPTGQIAEGAQFSVETSPGFTTNFICLGPGTGLCPDERGQYCSYAMLWE